MSKFDAVDQPPITVLKAAQITGLHVRTIRNAASAGRIAGAKKIGRDWLFTRAALDALMANESMHRPGRKPGKPTEILEPT